MSALISKVSSRFHSIFTDLFMKRLQQFLLTTLIGGVVVLLPLAIFVFIVQLLIRFIGNAIAPLSELINLEIPKLYLDLIALVGIVLFCFLVGLVVRTRLGRAIIRYVEIEWLERLLAARSRMKQRRYPVRIRGICAGLIEDGLAARVLCSERVQVVATGVDEKQLLIEPEIAKPIVEVARGDTLVHVARWRGKVITWQEQLLLGVHLKSVPREEEHRGAFCSVPR